MPHRAYMYPSTNPAVTTIPKRAVPHERSQCDALWDAEIDAAAGFDDATLDRIGARFDWTEGGYQRSREAVAR